MKQNILIFDVDTEKNDNLMTPLHSMFGIHTNFHVVSNKDAFQETISLSSWDCIIINFQTRLFLTMEYRDFSSFLFNTKKVLNKKVIFAGLSSDKIHRKTLQEYNVQILNKIYDHIQLLELLPTLKECARLKDIILIDDIKLKIVEHFNISLFDIDKKSRKRVYVAPRQIAMYLCTKLTRRSLKAIGDAFNGRDHSIVVHSKNTVVDLMDSDIDIKNTVENLYQTLRLANN